MASNQPTSDISDRSSGGTLSRLRGHRRSQSQSQSQSQPRHNATQQHSSNQRRDPALQYSLYSTPGPFHNRMFFSENFMLGAGAVVIQPSSGKVVVVQDGDHWFLPKGRKDLGESIEQAALREAYEEVRISLHLISPDRFDQHDHQSGYRCEFLPLYHWTNAPVESRLAYGRKHTEPLHVTITSYLGRRNRPPGEYLTFWYACQIGPEAVSWLPSSRVGPVVLKADPNRFVRSEPECRTRPGTSDIWSPSKWRVSCLVKSRNGSSQQHAMNGYGVWRSMNGFVRRKRSRGRDNRIWIMTVRGHSRHFGFLEITPSPRCIRYHPQIRASYCNHERQYLRKVSTSFHYRLAVGNPLIFCDMIGLSSYAFLGRIGLRWYFA